MMFDARERSGAALALGAVCLVGGSVSAATHLHGYPLIGGQAVRYGLATVFLLVWARIRKHTFIRPSPAQMAWVFLLAATGMAGYGVVLVYATSMTSPGNVGVALGAAPLIIVLVQSLLAQVRPSRSLMAGALSVACGSAVAQLSTGGTVQWSAQGFAWSCLALTGVCAVTLLGAPATKALGSLTAITYACALASGMLFLTAVITGSVTGTPVLRRPSGAELSALAFLALGVTTVVFLMWYGAVERLGTGRTGLFNGLIPLASLLALSVTGTATASLNQIAGAALVLIGVAFGLRVRKRDAPPPRAAAAEHVAGARPRS
ncbi:DMT family transporter [Streptomyces sp. 147326]|uniref:DMT family transporter n=1 Tax=Streptomyces sp. 147326 TaxID=3074379 RepID=UPI003857C314